MKCEKCGREYAGIEGGSCPWCHPAPAARDGVGESPPPPLRRRGPAPRARKGIGDPVLAFWSYFRDRIEKSSVRSVVREIALAGTVGGMAAILWTENLWPVAASGAIRPLLPGWWLGQSRGVRFAELAALLSLASVGALLAGGVLTHLLLVALGDGKHGYGATIRVLGHGLAFGMLLLVFPAVGVPAAVAFALATGIAGLKTVHGTAAWKAGIALILPPIVCAASALAGFLMAFRVIGRG